MDGGGLKHGTVAGAARRVLVLMPTVRDAERTAVLLREVNVPCVPCAEIAELCRELRAGADVVLLTEEAVSRDSSGQLAEALREQPAWSAIPLVVLAREGWTRSAEQLASPVFDCAIIVERPVRTATLLSVVTSALRARRNQYQIRDAILARERQAAELIAQDERLRLALSAGGLGSWRFEVGADEMECSETCKQNFGHSPSKPFLFRYLQEAIHPLDRERVRAAIERSLRTGEEYDVEHRIIWPNGETRWLLVRGRTTQDKTGGTLGMAGVSLDITDRKRMHEALEQSQAELARQAEELRRADRRKDEFLATLAHELRNPLAPIRTGMDLLARASDEQSRQRTLGVMHRQLAHMVRLIDDLLDVSRITRGKLELKRQKISLATAIGAAVEASRPLIERKQQTLSVNIRDGAMCSDADLTRIAQVISNLLNNASNYTPGGGSIELDAERDGDSAVIRVRDNGIGIPSDRLEDVFELFSQVNRTLERSQGGLGIGLALVRSLVEMHGGTVKAESAGLEQGSTFTVRLPLVSEAVESEPPKPSSALASGPTKRRVLVADDNEDAADLLTLSLEQAGYQTQTAYDGASALAGIALFTPDVAILDIGLPDMTGYDLARELRRNGRSQRIALIALTGWGSPDDKRKAFEAGFDFHLTKPVDAKDLDAALKELERRARAPHADAPSP